MVKKNVVAGLGEIGTPILKLIQKFGLTVGCDINSKLMNKREYKKFEKLETLFLHICIPFTENFFQNVISLYEKFKPEIIVIHSTVSSNTTKNLQMQLPVPVIYSATRGVYKRMLKDLKKYTKFFAIESNAPRKKWAIIQYRKLLKKCKIKSKQMSNPMTLEIAKIVCDTSYYGWLINYAQLSNIIALKHGINYDEMWTFADEIHKYLGNRPKMFPGFIGGHCIIPNLKLINNQTLDQIKEINNEYLKKIPNAKSIAKKHHKSKR